MSEAQAQSVLRRKAVAGRPTREGAPITAARALTNALAKSAQDLMGLALRVADVAESRMSLAEIPEALIDRSLLAILEGPAEGLGLVMVPPATMSALIEMQTMGRLGQTLPEPRKPTRIDATMAAEFHDVTLGHFAETLGELPDITWAGGFRYASFLDDPRPLGLILEDISYRVFTLNLQLGSGGEREGTLLLALPAQGRGAGPRKAGAKPDPEANAEPAAQDDLAALTREADWAEQFERSVLASTAQLDAVLHRVTLPLSAVMGLQVGMTIPVPYAALEELKIEGLGRRKLSMARLGQAQGMRAIRIQFEDEGAEEANADAAFAAHANAARREQPAMSLDEPLGDLPALGDFPAMGALPPLGDFPSMGDLPPLDDLPALKFGGLS